MVSFQQKDNDNFRKHASNSPPSSPDVRDIDEVWQLGPRIGPEYQIEVPSVIKKSKRKRGYWRDIDGTKNAIEHKKAVKVKKNRLSDNVEEIKPTSFQSVMTGDNCKSGQLLESKNYSMAEAPWSDADTKSFVLGLYIFGKNFIPVKKFLENKGMGEILSFYYGKFYKSDEYCRWSKCRKIKGRKCVIGRKLFSGQRRQELLSRLILHVPEETQDTLRQASESYVEGRTSLEEYTHFLKSTVGLGVLVEAVGIGKEKEDLTRFVVEPMKKNQTFSEPTCKPWSSLGPSEIMKFLTGDSRLSKTKSQELFWEAVWPRLLARGWHSEKPANNGYVTSKGYLVFLIPGVKKFSRRKLVKGNHYFDSVSDVLSKVVDDPDLLELDEEEARVGSCNEEEPEKGLCKDEESIDHPQCYLKPQASTCNKDHMEFMIIDTSLVQGGKSSDVRELKSVPVNSMGRVEIEAAAGIIHEKRKHTRKVNHKKDMSRSIKQKSTKSPVIDTSTLSGSGGKLLNVRQLNYPPAELEDASKMNGLLRERKGSSSNDDSPSVVEAKMLIVEVDAAAGIKHEEQKHARMVNHKKDMSKSIKQKSTKFPVTDTSILSGSGGKLLKVRQRRYAPAELEDASKMTGLLRESKGSSSKDDSPSIVEAKMLTHGKKNIIKSDSRKGICDSDATNKKAAEAEACANPDNDPNKTLESHKNQKTCELGDNQLKRTIKHQFNQRVKTNIDFKQAAVPIKRRRLTACAKAEEKRINDNFKSKPTLSQSSSFTDANKNAGDPVSHQKNGSSIASSAKRIAKESNGESNLNDNRQCTSITGNKVENCESLSQVTLKIPQVPSKSENGKMLAMVEEDHSKCQRVNAPYLASDTDREGVEEPLRTPCNGSLEEQPNINPRRQSTRSRPSVRALESIANDFLHVQRRPKRKDIQTRKDPLSPCRRTGTKGKTASRRHCTDHEAAVFVQEEKHLNRDGSVS